MDRQFYYTLWLDTGLKEHKKSIEARFSDKKRGKGIMMLLSQGLLKCQKGGVQYSPINDSSVISADIALISEHWKK